MERVTNLNSKEKTILFLIYLLPILCAFHNNGINEMVSISVLLLTILLFPSENFYNVLPILVFYYIQLRFMGGSVVVFRLYSILILAKMIRQKVVPVNKSKLPALFISTLFSFIVLYRYRSIQYVVMISFDLIIMAFIGFCLRNEDRFKKFSKYYIFAAVSSSIYNLIGGRAASVLQNYDGVLRTVSRYLATFNDPNYTGFYFLIALFLLIILKPYSRAVNMAIGCLIVITILSTVSTTAFIGIAVIGVMYLFLEKNYALFKKVAILGGILLAVVFLFRYGYDHPDTPFLGDAVYRFRGKLGQLVSATDTSLAEFTTGRSSGTQLHLQTFFQQPIWKMLLGFNPICAVFRDTSYLMESALNEYVDLLLSVGIVGWLMIMGPFIRETIKYFQKYRNTGNEVIQARLIIKLVWLYYGFALCFFMDSRFYFFYFL